MATSVPVICKTLFFKWVKRYDYYKCAMFNGAIDILINRYTLGTKGNNYGKWEIILNNCYWSRDNDKFFETEKEAMEGAEKLLRSLSKQILKKMGE